MAPVALDASLWDEPTTGIGLYTHELYRALVGQGHEIERWGARRSGERLRRSWNRSTWTLAQLPQLLLEHRPCVYHALSNFNLPLQRVPGVPLVLTVHDVVPLALPETVSFLFRWQFRTWLARSLMVADAVICVSEAARQSVINLFDVDPQKLVVIHHGVDHLQYVAPPDSVTETWLDTLALSNPFVLYAGALDARKNVELLLAACERLFERGLRPTLVLAGQRWFGGRSIERKALELKSRGFDIRLLGYLEAPVFYALMRRAGVFVFPSRLEGFGLPPLEAMALGVPTIVSTAGSLPEVCADGAIHVDPADAAGLAHHLERLLSSEEHRAQWATRGRTRAAGFLWAQTARHTQTIYDAVARPRYGAVLT